MHSSASRKSVLACSCVLTACASLPHVERAAARELHHARGVYVLGRAARRRRLPPARALGLAVVAPLIVRLAVSGEAFLAAFVRLLEAIGVDLRKILLGRAQQELEAIVLLPAQAFAADALRQRRRVGPRLPGEEHR